jgi:hypothetical protein
MTVKIGMSKPDSFDICLELGEPAVAGVFSGIRAPVDFLALDQLFGNGPTVRAEQAITGPVSGF